MLNSDGFIPVKPDHLLKNTMLTFDLFELKYDDYELFRSESFPVTTDMIAEIAEDKERMFFIKETDLGKFHDYQEKYLDTLIASNSTTNLEKAQTIVNVGGQLISELFSDQLNPILINRCNNIVKNLITFLRRSNDAAKFLYVSIPSGYSVYHHSLNVAALSLSLALELNQFKPKDLANLGLGAILHDIGMKTVPQKVINKAGRLNHREYMLVKKHVMWGVRILEELCLLDANAIAVVQDHHERVDGSGYPARKRDDEIHEFGRIAAIADVFDAITSARPYRQAVNPYPALKKMISFRDGFDIQFLKAFIKLLGENR